MKERLDSGGFEATHGATPNQGDDCTPPDRLLVWGHRTLGDRRDPEIPDALHFVLRDAGLVNNSSTCVIFLQSRITVFLQVIFLAAFPSTFGYFSAGKSMLFHLQKKTQKILSYTVSKPENWPSLGRHRTVPCPWLSHLIRDWSPWWSWPEPKQSHRRKWLSKSKLKLLFVFNVLMVLQGNCKCAYRRLFRGTFDVVRILMKRMGN